MLCACVYSVYVYLQVIPLFAQQEIHKTINNLNIFIESLKVVERQKNFNFFFTWCFDYKSDLLYVVSARGGPLDISYTTTTTTTTDYRLLLYTRFASDQSEAMSRHARSALPAVYSQCETLLRISHSLATHLYNTACW